MTDANVLPSMSQLNLINDMRKLLQLLPTTAHQIGPVAWGLLCLIFGVILVTVTCAGGGQQPPNEAPEGSPSAGSWTPPNVNVLERAKKYPYERPSRSYLFSTRFGPIEFQNLAPEGPFAENSTLQTE